MKIGICEQIINDMNNGVYDFTDNGKCIQCGQCCSNLLPMSKQEIDTIRRYIKKHRVKEHKHFFSLINPQIDMTCPFLDDGKKTEKCTIYQVRPQICKSFSCNPAERSKGDKELFNCAGHRTVVNVRETFYGRK